MIYHARGRDGTNYYFARRPSQESIMPKNLNDLVLFIPTFLLALFCVLIGTMCERIRDEERTGG